MRTSKEWLLYFEGNARSLLEVPWHHGAELTPQETADIAASLREFQAGESSEGRNLFRSAQRYADRTGDTDYVAAIRLFIAEEQRHARDLGRFLELNCIPLVKTTLTDRAFRKLRGLGGHLEVSIAVLITAEIIAKVYYAVVQRATQSAILRRICDQILHDEFHHVLFQAEHLAGLREGRGKPRQKLTMALQRFLYFGTVLVVWLFHRRAILRGGFGFVRWWKACWQEFEEAFRAGRTPTVRAEVPRRRSVATVRQ